ncbi:MAG: IPT/TIG domain-containing protein [Leptospiraceae bacterium]|nr:IPT/TIG domain-containing protein [Leptospiraceae bacterium]
MFKFLIFILVLLPSFLLYPQKAGGIKKVKEIKEVEETKEVIEEIKEEVEGNNCKSRKGSSIAFIEVFEPKDLSREQYEVMLNFKNPKERQKYITWSKEDEQYPESMNLDIVIDQVETRIARGTIQSIQDKGRVRFQIFSLGRVPEGQHCARLLASDGLTVLDEFGFIAPPRMDEPSKQPIVQKLHPLGGVAGDTIVITGKNFGDSIDKVSIEFLTKKGDNLNYWKEEVLGSTIPFVLSKEESNDDKKEINETIRFSVPGHPKLNSFDIREWLFGKTIYVRVLVNHRPATLERFTILNSNWKIIIIIISILVTIVFIGSLAFIIHHKQFYAFIVLDTKTNMYSLSKVQAFAWLVALLGSYFYVAICSGIILQNGKIPDFNYSLIGLMGISVGGLLTSNYLDNKTEKTKRKEKPLLIDLVMSSDGEIQLPKLQLLGFTAISIIIYIFNLLQSNVLAGLPDIPNTLHTLLLTSQGGFIGGKAINNRLSAAEKKPDDNKETESQVEEKESEDVEEVDVTFGSLDAVEEKDAQGNKKTTAENPKESN